ncbi:MAG TPA: DUF6491 family protein [Gammaproteobacteria bacterium]
MKHALVWPVAAALAAGCAATGTEGDRAAAYSETDCLWTSAITDWQPLDDRNLIVYAPAGRPYHVELSRSCFDLEFADVIAFYDRSPDERICGYGMDRVIVNRTIQESCGIASVDELTEEQAEELLRQRERQGAAATR